MRRKSEQIWCSEVQVKMSLSSKFEFQNPNQAKHFNAFSWTIKLARQSTRSCVSSRFLGRNLQLAVQRGHFCSLRPAIAAHQNLMLSLTQHPTLAVKCIQNWRIFAVLRRTQAPTARPAVGWITCGPKVQTFERTHIITRSLAHKQVNSPDAKRVWLLVRREWET